MTLMNEILTRTETKLKNALFNARALRDAPFENDKEKNDKLLEVITELAILHNEIYTLANLSKLGVK